ncbi:MAG TPA: HAD family hydrolase [Opitutaceae bacterium]|jgi:phosphoglycolate phosphatase-like HAD superfamily hydrolase|nr:HAD family hydrolase [Opitutaceae bacterium]
MRDRLVLWDIDGTLVTTGRSGERALLALARDLYQRDLGERLPVELAGRTDRLILRDLLAYLERPATEAEVARARAAYLAGLPGALALGPAQLLPGIGKALDAIHQHPSVHQALLTGNLKEGARLKLTHMEIWHYFEFGAFADDSAERNELGPFALARAQETLGLDFPPDRVWIIGDTPHDVACGKAIGAHTIAVATGGYELAALARCRPTHAVANLADTEDLLRRIQA